MKQEGSVFRGAMLVTGTAIGGGILGLPVVTSMAGMFPAIVIYILCWMFMTATALLMMETYLWMEGDVNLITMAGRTLGVAGQIYAWVLYLFLFYCLTLAYVVGCGEILSVSLDRLVSPWWGSILFVLAVIPVIYLGVRFTSRVNVFMMLGLTVFYFLFIWIGLPHIQSEHYMPSNWGHAIGALPVAFTAFAFHGIVPTLTRYLGRDVKRTRMAILIGSSIPLIAYIIWDFMIQGIIPSEGPNGLAAAREVGATAVSPLKAVIGSSTVILIGECFAFFAMVTSLFGVALGLVDFLSDGLKIEKTALGKFYICLIIFVPVLVISALKPGLFLRALDLAGGYGCALLLGLLPILMAWSLRYKMKAKSSYRMVGGKILLIALIAFVLFEVIVETLALMS